METTITPLFDSQTQQLLQELAAAMFPFDRWINGDGTAQNPPKSYTPDPPPPWRKQGSKLGLRDLGVFEFLEGLISESSGDADVLARFARISADPLQFSPLSDVRAWRESRGLAPEAEFGVIESENVLTDVDGHPIVRRRFYETYLPLVRATVNAALEKPPVKWADLGTDLLKDNSKFWPKYQPRKSSTFIKQFGRDLLYAMLGMRNPAPEPFRFALLIELGEGRRVGNAYTPEQVEDARARFEKALDAYFKKPEPASAVRPAAVGSPPVGPRGQ